MGVEGAETTKSLSHLKVKEDLFLDKNTQPLVLYVKEGSRVEQSTIFPVEENRPLLPTRSSESVS